MTADTDTLEQLCAAERAAEVPPGDAEDRGWHRLQAALWPGPGGGGEPSEGGDAGGSGGDALAAASGSGGGAAIGAWVAVGALVIAGGIAVATVGPSRDRVRDTQPVVEATTTSTSTTTTTTATTTPTTPMPIATTAPAATTVSDVGSATGPGVDKPVRTKVAALPDVEGEGLAHEVAIMREVSAALGAGRPRTALRWIRRHAADHPRGSLAEERRASEAIARCQLNDTRAAATATRFVADHPRSTHVERVRAACAKVLEP